MARQETTEITQSKGVAQTFWMTGAGGGRLMEREAGAPRIRRVGRVGARSLGWFSIGLGAAQLIAPRGMARMIGVRANHTTSLVLRALGAREVASGVGILLGGRPRPWLWTRVAGDAIDLALIGRAMGSRRADHDRLNAARAAIAGVTVLDVLAASIGGRVEAPGIEVHRSITINKSPKEIYRFWRSLDKLPQFMAHIESVQPLDDRRSRWTARGPIGVKLEWEAEIVEDRPGECIAWRSLAESNVRNVGEVRFVPAPGGRGTEVHVALRYRGPAGALGTAVAKLFGKDPGRQIENDLRRLKQVIETGEVVHSDASIHRRAHPGRPSKSVPQLPPTSKGGV